MRSNKLLDGLYEYKFNGGTKLWISSLVFLEIYLTSSFLVTNDIFSSFVVIGVWLLAFAIAFNKGKIITTRCYIPFVLLSIFFLLSYIFNGENIRNCIALLFSFLVSALICSKVSFRDFRNSYIYIMLVISSFSLVFYVIYSIFPFFDNINQVTLSYGKTFSNFYIYISDTTESFKRNQSLFWEPGAFQAYLNIAIAFELFSKSPNFKRLNIFLLALITTFSTTGYIALLILIFAYAMFSNKVPNGKWLKVILIVFIIAFILVVIKFASHPSNPFMKIVHFYNEQEWDGSGDITSASVRFFAIVLPIQAFLEKPLFGYGYNGLTQYTLLFTNGMNTCTMINWFAIYGVFFGLMMFYGYYKLTSNICNNSLARKILFVFFFIVMMSENFAANAFFFLLCLYGYSNKYVHE